jgi:hypothetical protein
MILDAKSGLRGRFFDVNGKEVRFVIWYDTEKEEYKALVSMPDGSRPVRPNVEYVGSGKLRFVPDEVLTAIAQTKPKAETPPVPEEVRMKAVAVGPNENAECEYPGCHRRAAWLVGDEQIIEPETGPDGKKYERGVIVKGHYYCDNSAHYRNPVSTSLRGVESELQVAARPQW